MPASGPHVLILSPGSKVALTRALGEAVSQYGGVLSGWERDPHAPAAHFCHGRAEGGPVEDAVAAHRLLDWCVSRKVKLVVPSRHDDLPTLAAVADLFRAAGITIAVSAPETIGLCTDKVATHAWLQAHSHPIPLQWSAADLHSTPPALSFPVIAKEARGSGSRSVEVCHSPADLEKIPRDWIVQSRAAGIEYTVNVYTARDGRCLCEIPHERILIGDGEVVRARTARIPRLSALARSIAESLPGALGPLNIQIFWDQLTEAATVIEINPRFGGGYPLAHEAGGRFASWLIDEYIGGRDLPRVDDWKADLLMVRYREALFFPAAPGG